MKKKLNKIWTAYENYVRQILQPDDGHDTLLKDIGYWRNETFYSILIYMAPVSLFALIPSVYMAWHNGFPVISITDILAFGLVLIIMLRRGMALSQRKVIFIGILYIISVVLIYYASTTSAGMLFLLGLTVLTSIIYSAQAAWYSVLVNSLICLAFGILIYIGTPINITRDYSPGTWVAVSSNLILLSLVCAKCLSLLITGLNNTMDERITAEKEARQLAERLTLITDSAGMGMWEWDVAADLIYWDINMKRINQMQNMGYAAQYADWIMQLYADDRERIDHEIKMALNGKKNYNTDFRVTGADGTIRYMRATAYIERDSSGRPLKMIGASWDITARRRQHDKLVISEANLSAIIQNTNSNIYSLDKDLRYITYNDMLAENIRRVYQIDIKPGDNILDVIRLTAPHEMDEWLTMYRKALSGTPQKFDREYNMGTHIETISFFIHPIIENGEVLGLSCYTMDITDLKQAHSEIRELNAGLERKVAERTAALEAAMVELEAFSYSVSHDLRSPVRVIMEFTNIINEDYKQELSPQVKEIFTYIQESGSRMNAIIDDLFVLAKYDKRPLKISSVDLNELLSNAWQDQLVAGPHHASLTAATLPVIEADRSMLQQVFVNLLSNAIKYSSKKEQPKIEVSSNVADGYITISIKDNGAGFDMKYYSKLFRAFKRLHTASDFEGTGIGLMLVKKIIEKHGGKVWAEGIRDEGATFYFSLPVKAFILSHVNIETNIASA